MKRQAQPRTVAGVSGDSIIVGRFLEDVVKDCGSENERFAKLALYLLTDENNTRPLKTRSELKEFIDI